MDTTLLTVSNRHSTGRIILPQRRRESFYPSLLRLVRFGVVPMLLVSAPLASRGDEPAAHNSSPQPPLLYEFRQEHDPNGIGKFYFGREIAAVMGHQGADWLERPEREEEEKPALLVNALNLRGGEVVADVGAGSGYITWRLARTVGDRGRVYGVDVQQEMLDLLSRNLATRRLTNVIPVLGTVTSSALPTNAIDLAIMVDVYHEFSHPHEMMQSICRSLKSGGRVVFVEYRGEDPAVPIKPVHKMTEDQVRKEMAPHPLTWEATKDVLPRQHIVIFKKR